MKAVRGSGRAATKAPRKQQQKPKKTTGKRAVKDQSDLGEDGRKTQQKPARKRTGPRGQENWQPISRSFITEVENIIDLAILTTLALEKKEKKESQEHLNAIKKGFLADCAKLKVPHRRQKHVEGLFQHHQEETKRLNVAKTTLSALEGDLRAVAIALEKAEEQATSLQQECSLLRDQVEEEEEKAKQMLQRAEHGALRIRFQPPEKDEPTLEARMRRMFAGGDADATARKLAGVLQTSEASRAARELLLRAHGRADRLPDFSQEPPSD
ncbi:unnamed protein product [Tetraodon nigroviridis]|uniref:Centromere protein Q n=1 Tax=Tetraodon nigroviridis TaxID=99883 RepID=Q4SHZ5_TETNG|nr:unnamed protein product [Tetraodon nigroviridis]